MQKLILGFAGEMAAGKGVATEIVKMWYPETPSFRFSDSLREFYTWLGSEFLPAHGATIPTQASTKDLQDISTKIRELFGENSLERAIAVRVKRCVSASPIIIIEGIRRLDDIRTFMGDERYNFQLIFIEAPPKIRWQRHHLRNEKPGDAELSFTEFEQQGGAEAETQIRLLRSHAHFVFDNGKTPAALESDMRKMFALIVP